MIKILIVREKEGNRYFDISSKEQKDKVYLKLFQERNKQGYYNNLIRYGSNLLQKAGEGNANACESIIELRSNEGYEYERIEIENLEEV